MRTTLEYNIVKTVNGQVGYTCIGTGRPLLMLVGYSGNLLHWNSELVYTLAKHYTVYLPDNRKVGLSDSLNPASIEGFALDIHDFIVALKLESPLIIGWSMGGIIAQALAYDFEEIISGVGLIVSQPDYSYTRGTLHQMVTALRENPGKENRESLMRLFFSELPDIEFRKYLAKTILPIHSYVYPFNQEAQKLQDLAVTAWKADINKLASLNLPMLITCAKNDLVTDPRASFFIHEHVTNSKLISYPTGGHFFLHYYPQELALEFVNFFR